MLDEKLSSLMFNIREEKNPSFLSYELKILLEAQSTCFQYDFVL